MSALELENNIFMLLLILLGLGLIGLAASYAIERIFRPERRAFRSSRPRRWNQDRSIPDPGQQLHAVMASKFEKRRVMNAAELRLFHLVEEEASSAGFGHRVFAQTSLGEVLASRDRNAFLSINSKRVDILIVDHGCWPVAAVEYQGKGHYQDTAAARDAVKKEALRKAGVRYIEVCVGDKPEQVRARLREQMGWTAAGTRRSATDAPYPSGKAQRA